MENYVVENVVSKIYEGSTDFIENRGKQYLSDAWMYFGLTNQEAMNRIGNPIWEKKPKIEEDENLMKLFKVFTIFIRNIQDSWLVDNPFVRILFSNGDAYYIRYHHSNRSILAYYKEFSKESPVDAEYTKQFYYDAITLLNCPNDVAIIQTCEGGPDTYRRMLIKK